MEFAGEDKRALSGLVRTLSGRLDSSLIDGDQSAGPGAALAEGARTCSVSEDVSGSKEKRWNGGLFGGAPERARAGAVRPLIVVVIFLIALPAKQQNFLPIIIGYYKY